MQYRLHDIVKRGHCVMTYKVIATILTRMEDTKDALDAAIAMAARMDAHLDIHIVTITQTSMAYDMSGMSTPVVAAQAKDAIAERDNLEKWLHDRMHGEVVRWSARAAMVQSLVLGTYLADKLRFCDLVVLNRPFEDDPEQATLVETSLFIADRPVMMIPKGAQAPGSKTNAIVGWDEGNEALAAVRAALPLLADAAETQICVIDPPAHAADQSDPGSDLAQFLTRHGAHAAVNVVPRTKGKVADMLLQCASDADAHLIVSGAYGHSRLREAVFGGTTRSLLENAPVPILMAR